MGNIFKEQSDNENAKKNFTKVLEISPDYSWAYFNLASIDYEEGNYTSALENLEKTLEYNPKDIDAYIIYAKILTKTQNFDNAKVIIEQALQNCGENGDLYYILAQINKLGHSNDEYVKNMGLSLKNNSTLSVSPKLVKKELDRFTAS